jgi:PAS domain S-box-containing protein
MIQERILIVEDDGIIATSVQRMLTEMGYATIDPVSTGEAAIDSVRINNPSLVLMDIKLAGEIDGITSAERIKEYSDVPIIYLTAFNGESTLAKAKITAPYGYLIKPVTDRELRASIEMASSRYALYRKLVESEKALRESEERYSALLDLGDRIGEAIIMLYDNDSRQGMHSFVSPRWKAITGYTDEELMNLSLFDIIHPRDRATAQEDHNRRMFCEVLPDLREFTIIRKDGAEIPVESTFAFSVFRGRQVDIGYLRDITERKKLGEQLITHDRLSAVGDMAFSIGHELNNPLSIVLGWTDLLVETPGLPAEASEGLQVIRKQIHRSAEIVRRLIVFAHGRDEGKTLVDINKLLTTVVELRSYEQMAKNITVTLNLAGDLPPVLAETYRLQQVCLNLLVNSEYFMAEANKGGSLVVTTSREYDRVKITITDDGPGIASDNLDGLFGSFFSNVPTGKGSGLSMGICRQLLKEVGGNIVVTNRAGRGSTITIELPASLPWQCTDSTD